MSYLEKEYVYSGHENLDGFLKFVGVPEDKIEHLASFKAKQKLVKNGDSYTMHAVLPSGEQAITFTSGMEFDDTIGPEKRAVKNLFVVDGNTVTNTVKSDKGEVTFKREYEGNDLTMTISAKGWDGVAKQFYKA